MVCSRPAGLKDVYFKEMHSIRFIELRKHWHKTSFGVDYRHWLRRQQNIRLIRSRDYGESFNLMKSISSNPLEQYDHVLLSLTKQIYFWNSTIALLSVNNLETLSKFLVIAGTCNTLVRWMSGELRVFILAVLTNWICKPKPFPICNFSVPIYLEHDKNIHASWVTWFVAPESIYQAESATTL